MSNILTEIQRKLHDEKIRLRAVDVNMDIADIMAIIAPYIEFDSFVAKFNPADEAIIKRIQEANKVGAVIIVPDDDWSEISTAPKDGRLVDLYAKGRRWADCHWTGAYWFSPYGIYDCGAEMELHGIFPTHWMRVPKRPFIPPKE